MFKKIFKNLIVASLLLVLLLTTSCTDEVQLDLPENFRILTTSNLRRHREELRALGYTPEAFALYLREPSMVIYAVSEDWSRQINLRIYESELSSHIGNLHVLSDEQLLSVKNNLLSQVYSNERLTLEESQLVVVNGVTFVRLNVRVESERANFSYLQLFTIANGQNISLTYYSALAEFDARELAEAEELFNSLNVNVNANFSSNFSVLHFSGGIVGILLLVLLLVWVLRAFIKDFLEIRREGKVEHIGGKKR